MSTAQRRLFAIMFSDMTGYSRMMGKDEEGTLALVEEMTSLMTRVITEHRGNVLKFIGDAVLATFDSASDAVFCAISVQQTIAGRNHEKPADRQYQLRIGIHIGDIVLKDNDVFGDGVNIAARLEPLAKPGGICVSQAVYDAVKARPAIRTVNLGPRNLKNIREPVLIHHVLTDADGRLPIGFGLRVQSYARRFPRWFLTIPALLAACWWGWHFVQTRKTSTHEAFTIAVAPFSGATPQAREEAAVMSDLIRQKLNDTIGLERDVNIMGQGITVTPHTRQDATSLGEKLGADIIIWGEVLVLNKQIEIKPYVTSVNASWSSQPRDPQALYANLEQPDQLRLREAKANELGNFALFVASRYYGHKGDNEKALSLLRRITPPTADSLMEQAWIHYSEKHLTEMQEDLNRAAAIKSGGISGRQMVALGHFLLGDSDLAIKELNALAKEKPDNAKTFQLLGAVFLAQGDLEKTLQYILHALDLNPKDNYALMDLGIVYIEKGNYAQAAEAYETLSRDNPHNLYARLLHYLCLKRAGEAHKAERYLQELIANLPPIQNAGWPGIIPYFFAGKVDEDAVLAIMNGGDPRTRLKRQMEGNFYLGMKHLLDEQEKDHLQRAQDAFKKCLATDLKHYHEYTLAEFELSRLN